MFSPLPFFIALILPLAFNYAAFADYSRVTQEDPLMKLTDYAVANDPRISLQIPAPFENLDPRSKDALNQLEIAHRGPYSTSKIRDLRIDGVSYSQWRESLVASRFLDEKPICIQIMPKPKVQVVKHGSPTTLTSWYNTNTGCIEWYVQKTRFPIDERRDKELNLQLAFAILHRLYGDDFPSSNSKIWYDALSINAKRNLSQLKLDEDVVYFKALARILAFGRANKYCHFQENDLKNAIFFSPASLAHDDVLNKIRETDDGRFAIFPPDISFLKLP
jgi:hypothetical protein